eukprot:scaffold1770_cov129-Isochrysis_galbana.AAC.1
MRTARGVRYNKEKVGVGGRGPTPHPRAVWQAFMSCACVRVYPSAISLAHFSCRWPGRGQVASTAHLGPSTARARDHA